MDRLEGRVRAQFLPRVVKVVADGTLAEREMGRDEFVGQPLSLQLQDLPLARGQSLPGTAFAV